jgi:hypothetical protein
MSVLIVLCRQLARSVEATASEDAATDSSRGRRRSAADATPAGERPSKKARQAVKLRVVEPVPMDVDEVPPTLSSPSRPTPSTVKPRGVRKPPQGRKPTVEESPEATGSMVDPIDVESVEGLNPPSFNLPFLTREWRVRPS